MREETTGHLPGISVVATRCETANQGTLDCNLFCRCDDGSDYAVKNNSKNPNLAHQEWFCTQLGERVGLASPPVRIVNVGNVECFGSRWESGMETHDWWVRASTGEIDFTLLAPTISRIFAYDLFIHNLDRHLKNYVVRRQYSGHAILAFDYSQAWLFNGFPLPDLPMDSSAKTLQVMRFLRHSFGDFIKYSEVKYVCDKLRKTDTEIIERIISEHPNIWLTEQQKSHIFTWWYSDKRLHRIHQVEEGIANGSCF
jgi:hypothetical protein